MLTKHFNLKLQV